LIGSFCGMSDTPAGKGGTMIIELADVTEEGQTYEGEEPPESLELTEDDDVAAAGPVTYRLAASRAGDSLVVRGEVEASIRFLCSRCSAAFQRKIVDRDFLRVFEDVHWDATVDLTPDLRETIILAFPTSPLCSPDCHGLCPQCGKNLNAGSCMCTPRSRDGRWGALDGLRLS
jgi:uncharacterized protein